jgi:hypothetical protein
VVERGAADRGVSPLTCCAAVGALRATYPHAFVYAVTVFDWTAGDPEPIPVFAGLDPSLTVPRTQRVRP